jgi:hypothetical protein
LVSYERQGSLNRRLLIFFLISLSAVVFGICTGEAFINYFTSVFIGFPALIALIPIGWFLGRPSKVLRWVFPILLPGFLAGAFCLASEDIGQAYRNCAAHGEELRKDLAQYKKTHGAYPEFLSQLGWKQLPGRRLIGGNILHYDGNKNGYWMYFTDGFGTCEARESEPFEQYTL